MKTIDTDAIKGIILLVLMGLVVLLALGVIALTVYAISVYGNTPISEAPVWVVWILQDGGSR